MRCSERTSNDFVLGELGFWRVKARRDYARLRYWGRLVELKQDSLLGRVYRERKREDDEKNDPKSWCRGTRNLLKQLGLFDYWKKQNLGGSLQQWKNKVRKILRGREEQQWRQRVLKKDKLCFYSKLKFRLMPEPYLFNRSIPKLGRYLITSLRSGTHKLRIETGRYVDEAREERVCEMCGGDHIEDEKHFLTDCRAYEDMRAVMYNKIRITSEGALHLATELDQDWLAKFLLGDVDPRGMARNAEIQKIVGGYVLRAMSKRARRLGVKPL